MRTALYGGTFDPIHLGHLILAREAKEQLGLDRLVFIPAALSPHKPATHPVPAALRLQMVQAAIAGEPGFECDDSEIHREGVSYTIDTISAWKLRAPGDELFYLIGHDNVRELHTWRKSEQLLKLVQFVVFDRVGCDVRHDFPRVSRQVDISATEVRKRVAAGQSIRYLVPEPVRALIEQHRLYLPVSQVS